MKNIFIYALLIIGFLTHAQKPNVIIINTDDQGYGDIAAHGNTIIKTPHMDLLHQQSVRLNNHHAGTTCAPSRSSLMSGIDGNRAGVWHTVGGCNLLRKNITTLPDMFQQNKYKTAMFGKWHLGDAAPYLPHQRGFDYALYHGAGGVGQAPDLWENDYFDDAYFINGKTKRFKGYCTDVYFDEAIQFMDKNKKKPFFVYLAPNAPHSPFNVPEEYYNIYKDEKNITDKQKVFYGMITNIDDNLKKLDKWLLDNNLIDNTILIFTTDNGTASGYFKQGKKVYGYNAGMKGTKSKEYDGGHRVPMFIRWPKGNLADNQDIEEVSMNYDLMPTLQTLCELKLKNKYYDGRDFSKLLKKPGSKWKHRYTVIDNNRRQQPKKWHKSAVMDRDWRLINGKELYHIREDIGQTKNVAELYPEKFKEMKAAYELWWDDISPSFSHYEAYEINDKHPLLDITIHDFHSEEKLAWNQWFVRMPYKKERILGLAKGHFLVDIQEAGEYTVRLARWPFETNYNIDQTIPQLGEKKPWYMSMPAGIDLKIKTAGVSVGGFMEEKEVSGNEKFIEFNLNLSAGRHKIDPYFINHIKKFSAFYVQLEKK